MSARENETLIGVAVACLLGVLAVDANADRIDSWGDWARENVREVLGDVADAGRGAADWLEDIIGSLPGPGQHPDADPGAWDQVEIAPEDTTGGYYRAAFGRTWPDLDGDGCDERNEVLARDLSAAVFAADGCTVLTGTLVGPYTGATIEFVRGVDTSRAVQIDHVVPLAEAWESGAAAWTAQQRATYANDLDGLLAVDGPTNGAKGSRDLAEWLPPDAGYHCTYVAAWGQLKADYDLSADQAEADTAADVLSRC